MMIKKAAGPWWRDRPFECRWNILRHPAALISNLSAIVLLIKARFVLRRALAFRGFAGAPPRQAIDVERMKGRGDVQRGP